MKPKATIKIAIDFLMTVVLLILMAYSLIGETAHEWLGIGILALFLLHHMLNLHFAENLFKGKYTPYRIVQSVLVGLIFCTMLGSCISGIILSKSVFTFLSINFGRSFARVLHLLSSNWGFVLMSLHLGLHLSTLLGTARRTLAQLNITSPIKNCKNCNEGSNIAKPIKTAVRIAAIAVAAYGVYAFFVRNIWEYMLLKTRFVFFNFDEPLFFFFADYLAVMWLFVFVAYYCVKLIRRKSNN